MIQVAYREDDRSVVRFRRQGDGVLCVLVECPDARNKAAASFLVEKVVSEQSATKGAPEAVARSIDHALKEARAAIGLPAWVMFVGVLIGSKEVEVCVVGPHRVHLVSEGRVIASTREHVLRSDPQPPGWDEDALVSIDIDIHGGIVTRSLGKTTGGVPETTVWVPPRPCDVVVCSSDFHQDRDPLVYVAGVVEQVKRGGPCVLILQAREQQDESDRRRG